MLTAELMVLANISGDAFENAILRAIVQEIRRREREGLETLYGIEFVHFDQAFGIAIRQWLQQDPVNDTENRAIGSDAERESRHRNSRKARIAAQHANAKAKVLPGIVHD